MGGHTGAGRGSRHLTSGICQAAGAGGSVVQAPEGTSASWSLWLEVPNRTAAVTRAFPGWGGGP
jgi:hypothetical protein